MSALSTAARNEYYVELANALPTPTASKPDSCERRLTVAVEAFEALRPADAYEARLAVRIVLCGAHAVECLREADCYRQDYVKRTHCRAQAASMMRGENAAKRMLEREQKVRQAVAAVAEAGADRPAAVAPPQRSEILAALPSAQAASPPVQATPPAAQAAPPPAQAAPPPAQAAPPPAHAAPPPPQAASPPLQAAPPAQAAAPAPSPRHAAAAVKLSVPTAAAAPPPAPIQPPATPPRPAAATRTAPPVQAVSAPPPSPEAIAKAEAFARENFVAAARIRHSGGITPDSKAYSRHLALPSDPAVIHALMHGTSRVLTMLDAIGGAMLDAAD